MDKTARQDPLLEKAQNLLPAFYPFIRRMLGTKNIKFGDYEGRVPTGALGIFDISKVLPEFMKREELEQIYEGLTEEADKFRRSLAYNINKNVFHMDKRAAWEHAKNKFTAGSTAALMLMKSGGADKIYKNLEDAARTAGVSVGSVSGLKAKARNQKISNMLATVYSQIIDPDNLGKMGNLDALEASTLVSPAIRSGLLNNVIDNPQAWGNNYQMRPEYANKIKDTLFTISQGISEAKDVGIVQGNPRQAWGQLTQVMGRDPITSTSPETFRNMMRDLDYSRRAAGMSQKDMRKLLPQAIAAYRKAGGNGIQALGAVKGYLAHTKAQEGAYSANINPRKYNKKRMGIINKITQNLGSLVGATAAGALSSGVSKEKVDEALHTILSDPDNLQDASTFVAKMGDLTGARMNLDNLKYLKNTPEALQYQARGDYLPSALKLYRDMMKEDLYKAMEEPGLSYIQKNVYEMGGPFDANLKAAFNRYEPRNPEGVNPADIAYGEARERLGKVFQDYGMSYDEGQRFLQSIPSEKKVGQYIPGSPPSQAQASDYLDRHFEEMYNRRNMPSKVDNQKYVGGSRGVTQVISQDEWDLGDAWEGFIGDKPEVDS